MKGTDPAQLQRLINHKVLEVMDPHSMESNTPRSPPKLSNLKKCLKTNTLTLLLLLSVIAGVGLGFILRTRKEPWSKREIMYLNFPGDIFLRMLKCLILPLIGSSLISAVGGLDLRVSGKIGLRAVIYYMATTIMAVVLGIVLVVSIHPGQSNADEMERTGSSRNVTIADTMLDLVRNLFPPNIVEACVSQYRTSLIYPGLRNASVIKTPEMLEKYPNATTVTKNESGVLVEYLEFPEEVPILEWEMKGENADGTNILGVVIFCVFLGISIAYLGNKAKPLYAMFVALADVMMVLTHWVIWISPIGILFLVSSKILEMKDFTVLIGQLGMYTLTVLIGLIIHGLIVLPLIFTIITRTLPFRFIFNMMQALTTAWGTSSSSAALPITIACLEEKNLIDSRISRFVLPIGATINMDGTALYEAVAAIFISQIRQIDMDIGKIIAVSITATAASIGAAGIPQAGLVTMVMVLNAVGLPADDVTLIIVIDWFLDRFRTMINVLGDSLGAGIVSKLSQKELEKLNSNNASEIGEKLKSDTPVIPSNGFTPVEAVENHITSM